MAVPNWWLCSWIFVPSRWGRIRTTFIQTPKSRIECSWGKIQITTIIKMLHNITYLFVPFQKWANRGPCSMNFYQQFDSNRCSSQQFRTFSVDPVNAEWLIFLCIWGISYYSSFIPCSESILFRLLVFLMHIESKRTTKTSRRIILVYSMDSMKISPFTWTIKRRLWGDFFIASPLPLKTDNYSEIIRLMVWIFPENRNRFLGWK